MFKRTKLLATLTLVFILTIVLANCAPLTSGTRTLTIAVVESDPGEKDNPNAQAMYAGVKLAVDQINAREQVKIQIDLYTDKGDPVQAQLIASEIVKSNAVAVIGHSSIETSDAAAEIYDREAIPVINVIPVTEHLTERHPYHFNITYTAESEAAYLANYLVKLDDKVTAGIIHTGDPADLEAQKQFRNQFAELGGVVAFRKAIALPEVVVEPPAVEGDATAIAAAEVPFQVSDVEPQLKEIVAGIVEIPSADLPRFLFIAANKEITDRLTELLQEKGISIPVKNADSLSGTTLADMIGTKTASIIATNDEYGKTLAKQFRNTFVGLGGEVLPDKVVDENGVNGQSLDSIVSDLISGGNPGTIFIATDDKTAADLLVKMKRKGVSVPIVGASTLSSPAFLDLIGGKDEEKTFPGYFTNGILTTHAIIFDSANRYANQFLTDYQEKYKDNANKDVIYPGDNVINGYDAVLALVTALQRSELQGDDVVADRKELFKALLGMDDSESSAQGIVSPIFFEPSRNTTRAARFGIYQNGEIVSANVQFEPITNPNQIKDLQDQIKRGRIMTVNGGYVYKANIVYSGVDLLGIDEIDIKTSTYRVDFYLWFRYRPNERDVDFKPDDFVFTNAEGDVEIAPIREETNADGTVLKTYRVSGTFKHQFRFYDYPFEHQELIVEFRNQNATTSFIQYVVDRIGMRYENEDRLLANYRENGAFSSVFGWKPQSAQVDQDIFPTFSTFGNPQNFGRSVATNYSLINVNVDIQRDSLQYIVKSLLPLLITLILAYITFFLPLGHSERLAVGSTALLTTAFFHLTLADALPEIGYTVAMEYLFYASYLMSALIVLLETLSTRYEKMGEDAKKKAEKLSFHHKREQLDLLGRIIYPSILVFVIIAGIFVYNGNIHFGPKEAEAKQLPDLAIAAERPQLVKSNSEDVPSATGDQVKLTLSTWRPEDTKQIQKLLDAFQAYAQSQGRNIVVEHRPVVSVNYDSILDIKLSTGDGPDLFYVRPFSVDGSIAKYLTRLNDDLDIQGSYDTTKIVPWTNKTGSYYAVPYVGVVQGVYYNEELFKRYGLTVPRTWNQFMDAVNKISAQDPDMIPIANALNETEDSEMFMSIAANFLGGPDGRESLMRTDGTSLCYNDKKVVSTFQAIEDLKPFLPSDAANINSQNSKELFFKGQAVMLFGGSWDLQTVSDKADFAWGVFAVPSPTLQTYVIFQPDVGIGINRESAHSEEAKFFLEWMMSEEAVNLTAKNLAGFYPLNNKVDASQASDANDEKFLKLVNTYDGDIRWMYTEISSKIPSADAIIRQDLYNMVAFDLTPQEAAQQLQSGLGEWYEPAQSCK